MLVSREAVAKEVCGRENGYATEWVQGKQIRISSDNRIRLPANRQLQKLVVPGITTFGDLFHDCLDEDPIAD